MSQLVPFPGRRDILYDFKPFLTAPAVKTALQPLTPPSAIAIPETQIASPLAANLAPHTLLDLQEHLCGTNQSAITDGPIPGGAIASNGRWTGSGNELGAKKGREIWESWKRAWDLWNGHYIEGRTPDPAWIRIQYDKLKIQVEKETKERIKAEKERVRKAALEKERAKKAAAEQAKIKKTTGGPYSEGPYSGSRPFGPGPFSGNDPFQGYTDPNNGSGNNNNDSWNGGSSGDGNDNGNNGSGNGGGQMSRTTVDPGTGNRKHCGENPPPPRQGRKWVRTGKQCTLQILSPTKITQKTGRKKLVSRPYRRQVRVPNQDPEYLPAGSEVIKFEEKARFDLREEQVTERAGWSYPIRNWATNVQERQRTGKALQSMPDRLAQPEDTSVSVRTEITQRELLKPQLQSLKGEIQPPRLTTYGELQTMRTQGGLPKPPNQNETDTIYEYTSRVAWVPVVEEWPTGQTKKLTQAMDVPGQEMELDEGEENVIEDETVETQTLRDVKATEWKEVDDSYVSPPQQGKSPSQPGSHGNGNGHTQPPTGKTPPNNSDKNQGSTSTTQPQGNTTTANQNTDSDEDMMEMDPDDDFYPDHDLSFLMPVERGTPAVPKLRPAVDVVENDGSTGGFMPMKLLPEYLVPPPNADGNYPDWEDVIANTVWRPRRVGEKTLSIGLDQDWGINTEFEFDGGVDCGRSPYPVLRYIVEYFKHEGGCWRKKKIWDRVFGTIFNMPTLPLDGAETPDERRQRMEALYGDFLRDKSPSHRHEDYFPLDIRRVDKLDPKTKERYPGTPLIEPGEELVRWPWSNKDEEFPDLAESDPWWVTDEQEELREAPPRKWPPGKQPTGDGTILPTDDRIWKEEVENDEQFRCRYFVTNLHGGTLVINGIEVKKGRIAVPLPEFAVIETPGNQVSFWFGPGGRDWRAGKEEVTYESQWRTLRNMKGWEMVGLTAGQVWDVQIRDRLRREHTGEDQNDDSQWAEWKRAEIESTHESEKIVSPLYTTIWNGPGTNPTDGKSACLPEFSTEEEELQWLLTKAYPLKDVTPMMEADNLFEPPEGDVWPGPSTSGRPDIVAQQLAQKRWDQCREKILEKQRKLNALHDIVRSVQEREKQEKVDAENKKRKAESDMGTAAKKARLEEAQAEAKAAADKKQGDYLLAQDAYRKAMAEQKIAREQLQYNATVAAKLRAWKDKLEVKPTAPEELAAKNCIIKELSIEQEAETLRRQIKLNELKKNREQQGQGQSLEPQVLSGEDALILADARKKQAEAARKKRADTAQKRSDEERRRKQELAAAKANEEQAKKDQASADQEARRVQFEEDQKKQAAQNKIDEAKAAENVMALQRAALFKEKYGSSPKTGLTLDASGDYESGQGVTPPAKPTPPGLTPPGPSPPKKTPPAKPPPGTPTQPGYPDIDSMTEEEQIEFAQKMSLGQIPSPSTEPENGPEFFDMTRGQKLNHVLKPLGKDADSMSHQEKTDYLRSYIRSLLDPDSYKSAELRLQQRALSEGITSLKYAQNRGYQTVEEYLGEQIRNIIIEKWPCTWLTEDEPADQPADALQVAHYWIDIAARQGVRNRARIEGRTEQFIVRRKGYDTVDEYVLRLQDSIRIEDMPPAKIFNTETRNEINFGERLSKWFHFWERIMAEFEFEFRIDNLPANPGPRKGLQGMIYAEF